MKNKRGFLIKLIIIGLVLLGIFFWVNNLVGNESDKKDLECVPATCCHPTECVPKSQEQDCAAVSCTAECEPGTLDCNQARCEALNGKCEVVLNN